MILKKIELPNAPVSPRQKLLLVFAGWGIDETPFLDYTPDNHDLIIAYDYSSLQFDDRLLLKYKDIKVIAWSMGVWAASQILPNKANYPITYRIAVNGTHFPIDDERGIPQAIYRGTLSGLNEKVLNKFRRRMCNSEEILRRFLNIAPNRTIDDLRKELTEIKKMVEDSAPSNFVWDRVYIGRSDLIFPSKNQRKAWQGEEYCLIDEGHYPEKLFQTLLQ